MTPKPLAPSAHLATTDQPCPPDRLALVAINARHSHTNLALRYARSALHHTLPGAQIQLVEYTIRNSYLSIIQDLLERDCPWVLFSVYIWNSPLVRQLLTDLGQLRPQWVLIAGGPEVAYNPQQWLQAYPALNLVVQGSAEGAVAALAARGFTLPPERLLTLGPTPFAPVPCPWSPNEVSALAGRYLYYETSRGCPFACSYCLSSRQDQALDAKPAAQVIAELEPLLAAQPMMVKFVDRTFNANPARAREIWRFLRDWSVQDTGRIHRPEPDNTDTRRLPAVPQPTRFHFEVQAVLLQNEDYELLATVRQGVFQFEMGIQSTTAATLREVSRPVPWEATRERIERLLALGNIHGHVDMIVGLPGENLAQIASSFNQILALGAPQFQMGFLKALPGTEIHQRAQERGMVFMAAPPYQLLESPWLSAAELYRLGRVEQLLDSVVAPGLWKTELAVLARHYGGYFEALWAMAEQAAAVGFDLSTKQGTKLGAFVATILADHTG
jgi:radical SAM superfamily enzyme YgiQ (UPF0313 family)